MFLGSYIDRVNGRTGCWLRWSMSLAELSGRLSQGQ